MARPSARSGNSAHSRRAGDGPSYCPIPPQTAPAQGIQTRCLPCSTASIPHLRSNSRCSSTSLTASPTARGSRWHHPAQDQGILRRADELETGRHAARSRRALPPRNVSQPDACHTARLAFQSRVQTHTAYLLPLPPVPLPGEVDGTTQREIRKFHA